MSARVARVLAGLCLLCAATAAPAQGIKLGTDDSYQDREMPARRNAPATQAAAGAATGGGQSDFLETKRVAIALALVLGAIYVSNRVWKRLGMPGVGSKASGSLQVMSRLVIAPKQQIMLIRVGRRLVLVGNSGGQMTALSEISDPEETAGIIGQVAVEQEHSTAASFNDVLGGEEKQFDPVSNVDAPPGEGQAPADEESSMATTRDELQGLMDKVRGLSQQFRQEQRPSMGDQR